MLVTPLQAANRRLNIQNETFKKKGKSDFVLVRFNIRVNRNVGFAHWVINGVRQIRKWATRIGSLKKACAVRVAALETVSQARLRLCVGVSVSVSAVCRHCSHYLFSIPRPQQSEKWQPFNLTSCHSGALSLPLPRPSPLSLFCASLSFKGCPTLLPSASEVPVVFRCLTADRAVRVNRKSGGCFLPALMNKHRRPSERTPRHRTELAHVHVSAGAAWSFLRLCNSTRVEGVVSVLLLSVFSFISHKPGAKYDLKLVLKQVLTPFPADAVCQAPQPPPFSISSFQPARATRRLSPLLDVSFHRQLRNLTGLRRFIFRPKSYFTETL